MMHDLVQSFAHVPASMLGQWAIIALVAFTIITFLVRAEGRHFREQGLGSAWLKLRVATLPILAISIAVVVGTFLAIGIGGPEALAVAYLTLLIVGPLVHFGLHIRLGRSFGLARGQAAWVAFSGLIMIGIIPGVAGFLTPYLYSASQALGGMKTAEVDPTPVAPLPYRAVGARRLTLPNQEEVWAIHYQAPAGITLVRIDMQTSNHRANDMLRMESATMCRRNDDLHLMWPADRPLPTLHVFWKDDAGKGLLSLLTPQAPRDTAEPFTVDWAASTLRLPIAVSRSALSLAWKREGGSPMVKALQEVSPGTDCAPQEINLPEQPELGRPNGLRLRADHTLPKGPTWADFRRPEAGEN